MSDLHFWDALLGALFGGLVTLALTIWIEHLRSPRVSITIGEVKLINPLGPYANSWRSIRVQVSNEVLPSWQSWWLLRLPAQLCRAEILFLRNDGSVFIDKPMVGRWTDSPEPQLVSLPTPTGSATVLNNPNELKDSVDIYPGDSETLDVATRVDGEQNAYGWNTQTYFVANWRNPAVELADDRYLVEVTITSSGRKSRNWFCLHNDGPFASFRLTELTEDQKRAVSPRRLA